MSAWNFVVANKDLPIETAYAIIRAVLSAADPKSEIYPTAAQLIGLKLRRKRAR